MFVHDAVGEWWIRPLATYQDQPYPRTVFGAVGHDGAILACEINHDTGCAVRSRIAQAGADDHNVPALWIANGRRPIILWTNHNQDRLLRFKVGDRAGDLRILVESAAQAIDVGGRASYAQVHRIAHLSDEAQDTLWVFVRRNNTEWLMQALSIEQSGGAVTVGRCVPILRTAGRQAYVSTADAYARDGNQTIRIAWGYNPAQSVHAIRYFELECVTGAVTSPFDPDLNARVSELGEDGCIEDDAIVPMIREPGAGRSRRLFYVRPGPDSPAVAHAEWKVSYPDAAMYCVTEIDAGGSLVTHALGPAGPRVGYTPEANYIAGLAFEDPSHQRAVIRAWSDGRSDLVDRVRLTAHGSVETVLAAQPSVEGRLIRPYPPGNGGPIAAVVTNMTHYGEDYRSFHGDMVGLPWREQDATSR